MTWTTWVQSCTFILMAVELDLAVYVICGPQADGERGIKPGIHTK